MNTCGAVINLNWKGKAGSVRGSQEVAIVGSIDAKKAEVQLTEDLHKEGKQDIWTEIKGVSQ